MPLRIKSVGSTRSSVYRHAKGDPWLQALFLPEAGIRSKIQRLNDASKKAAEATHKWMERKPLGVSASTWMARRDDQKFVRRYFAELATKAKQKAATERAQKARALKDPKKTQKAIAAEIGITDRGLRKLLTRRR